MFKQIFKDQTIFKILDKDPAITLQHLQNLCNRGEISKTDFDQIRSKNAKPAKAHGHPKIHKTFANITKFRTIIDTTVSGLNFVRK